jgi:hypothetical protein
MRNRREDFVAARSPLSHQDFCTRLGVGVRVELAVWVVCVRRAMGCVLAIPPSVLRPDDTWIVLLPLVPCDWDDVGVVLALDGLGVEFPSERSQELPRFLPGRFFGKTWPAPATFGEWTVAVSNHLVEHGCRLTRRARRSISRRDADPWRPPAL